VPAQRSSSATASATGSARVVVERPGLVDDRVRDADLADVVQQRTELGAASLLIDTERVGHAQRQLDHVSRGLARVPVVGLDHVAEQQRRSLVSSTP
jgi:hypothetical protein